ncbi:hypothetical protein LguiA_020768 [Lonicera macranthoides]
MKVMGVAKEIGKNVSATGDRNHHREPPSLRGHVFLAEESSCTCSNVLFMKGDALDPRLCATSIGYAGSKGMPAFSERHASAAQNMHKLASFIVRDTLSALNALSTLNKKSDSRLKHGNTRDIKWHNGIESIGLPCA